MFSKASNKRSLLSYSGNAAFKKRIAPKIAAHIQQPIDVCVTGEDTRLNAWLIDNLSTIVALHITSATAQSSRGLAKSYPKKAKYE
ncbi:MAG: hypothetical protein CFE62_001085 [Candidatus Aquirickettsiella gammari]|jgi:hypothetical protein|uniref:Uncharacterized protein n=1 Tax=Candidatus Aquirickettsiella gammari TaxID=2016198 RepID=A0A370CLV0_9COXI|nr:MAG: hypothetical protein CFE62_001085 [Candidatus Aquirickettsiella gammari]